MTSPESGSREQDRDTLTMTIDAPGFSFVATYPADAFDSAYFMEAMTWKGRDWEVGFPEYLPLPVGAIATITLPEFEFTSQVRVVAVHGNVVTFRDVPEPPQHADPEP